MRKLCPSESGLDTGNAVSVCERSVMETFYCLILVTSTHTPELIPFTVIGKSVAVTEFSGRFTQGREFLLLAYKAWVGFQMPWHHVMIYVSEDPRTSIMHACIDLVEKLIAETRAINQNWFQCHTALPDTRQSGILFPLLIKHNYSMSTESVLHRKYVCFWVGGR